MSDHDLKTDAWRVSPSRYLQQRPALFDIPEKPFSQYVEMRDGCRLAVDVYLPKTKVAQTSTASTWPTIVIFTPYYRRFVTSQPDVEPSPNCGKYRDIFVPRGYAVVVVDVRGTGASFGTRDSLRSPKERDDSYEIAQWIVEQSWSNGLIGSTGISYLGAAAIFLASTGHPAVKAIAPLFAVSDIYKDQLYVGGVLSSIWAGRYNELMMCLDQDDRQTLRKFAYYGSPLLAGPQAVDDDVDATALAQAIAQHKSNCDLGEMAREVPFRDDAFLHDPELSLEICSPAFYTDLIPDDVAIYSISGWLDGAGYSNSAISRFMTLTRQPHRLLLGPWDHGARSNVSPWREQAQAQFPVLAEVLRFFDHYLCSMPTELNLEAPVHYFTMHAEKWQDSNTWPPFKTTRRLYASQGGELTQDVTEAKGQDSYQVDFSVSTGMNTRYERLGAVAVEDYYPDWTQRQSRMLNFTMQPFESSIELTGHITAHLSISASENDAAIYLYVSEILSDGSAKYVTEGILRALHREGVTQDPNYRASWPYGSFERRFKRLLKPDEEAILHFALLPISWVFERGSQLRISMAGSDEGHSPQVPHGRPPKLTIHCEKGQTWFELPFKI